MKVLDRGARQRFNVSLCHRLLGGTGELGDGVPLKTGLPCRRGAAAPAGVRGELPAHRGDHAEEAQALQKPACDVPAAANIPHVETRRPWGLHVAAGWSASSRPRTTCCRSIPAERWAGILWAISLPTSFVSVLCRFTRLLVRPSGSTSTSATRITLTSIARCMSQNCFTTAVSQEVAPRTIGTGCGNGGAACAVCLRERQSICFDVAAALQRGDAESLLGLADAGFVAQFAKAGGDEPLADSGMHGLEQDSADGARDPCVHNEVADLVS